MTSSISSTVYITIPAKKCFLMINDVKKMEKAYRKLPSPHKNIEKHAKPSKLTSVRNLEHI